MSQNTYIVVDVVVFKLKCYYNNVFPWIPVQDVDPAGELTMSLLDPCQSKRTILSGLPKFRENLKLVHDSCGQLLDLSRVKNVICLTLPE